MGKFEDAVKQWHEGHPANAAIEAAKSEIERLRRDCAEAYQVVGTLSGVLWDNENVRMEDVTKALDNLLAAANGEPRPHDDLLPFPAVASSVTDGALRGKHD